VWLPWQYAFWLAVACAVTTVALRVRMPSRRWLRVRELTQESAIFAVLYAVWQRIGEWSLGDVERAVDRGAAIARWEHLLHFPSEQWTQGLALHSHLLIKAANWYYIIGHTPVLGVFLVWLYLGHRSDFARWRTTLAVGSIVGELIQIVPVAPPRLTLHGIIDTGHAFGPTVYDSSGAGFAPQLAAMPSLHVVWAITAGAAVFTLVRGPLRWIGPLHAVLTVLAVVVTGNHYWLDAVAGGVLVVVGYLVHVGASAAWRARQRRRSAASAGTEAEPDREPAVR
jgi:hypothetical protein